MEPNQNPPSEREWTPEEMEEFFSKTVKDASEDFIANAVTNGVSLSNTEPITLDGLLKMKAEMDAKIAELGPIKFKNGADMNQETFDVLSCRMGLTLASKDNGKTWFDPHVDPLISIQIHIRPDIPFGEARECTCDEFLKIKPIEKKSNYIVSDEILHNMERAYKLLPGGYVDETGPHRGVPPTQEDFDRIELLTIHRKLFNKCEHERLNEDGYCRSCGEDCRGAN